MSKYYIAYGSNLNIKQMTNRCPTAIPLCSFMLEDMQLEFRSVATIVPREDAMVPVGLWQIDEACEAALDLYEGYPNLYRKEFIEVPLWGSTVTAMVYIMNGGSPALPSDYYLGTILTGYRDFDMDNRFITHALEYTNGLLD